MYLRSERGSHVVEFAAGICILVGFILLPLLDIAVVPVRWMMAQELVNDYARKLALCETFSIAYSTLEADPSLAARLQRIGGVELKSVSLRVRVDRVGTKSSLVDQYVCSQPRQFAPEWLPNGSKAPCSYTLELDVQSRLAPAILLKFGDAEIPGLTAPIPLTLKASHDWANLGKNPRTGRFFLNE